MRLQTEYRFKYCINTGTSQKIPVINFKLITNTKIIASLPGPLSYFISITLFVCSKTREQGKGLSQLKTVVLFLPTKVGAMGIVKQKVPSPVVATF